MFEMKKLFDWLFNIKSESIPPWVHGTYEGKLYIDKTDVRWQAWYIDTLKYLNQWELKDGKMIKSKDLNLKKPNNKDYY